MNREKSERQHPRAAQGEVTCRNWRVVLAMACLTVGVAEVGVLAVHAVEDQRQDLPKRALPPKWSRDVLDTFFPDAREQLQGDRPDYASLKRNSPARGPENGAAPNTATAPESGFRWSELIRPETLEDEVKRLDQQLAESVGTPLEFKGGSYRACRRCFSELAVLFGVIGEYGESVRWHRDAPTYRDLFARAGFNCKVGTDQSFNEAQLRVQDLQGLIRGSRTDAPEAERAASWPQVADRVPLMRRMEVAEQERLSRWLASASEFRSNAEEVRHEAELLAMLAEIISREGYEFANDDQYAAHAQTLQEGALAVAGAAERGDYAAAEAASANLTKACSHCHEGFR